MHCKDCKHFEAPTGEYEKGWGNCALGRATGGDPDIPTTLAFGWDYEGYSSGMGVRPEFGCVQFEAKDAS